MFRFYVDQELHELLNLLREFDYNCQSWIDSLFYRDIEFPQLYEVESTVAKMPGNQAQTILGEPVETLTSLSTQQ